MHTNQIMSFKKPTSIKDFAIHLGVLLGTTLFIVAMVFYVWLPITTNHGETITVPDVQGMAANELDDFLGKRDLRWESNADSSYSADSPPLTVLRQVPLPNTKVKENRKIYVTLNAASPPKVRMPNLIDRSIKAAVMILNSYDLKRGEIQMVPDDFFVVVDAKLNGRSVLEGEKIEKGSTIDLVVGSGYGNTIFQSPNLIGLDEEEATVAIVGSGLKVGKVSYTDKSIAGFDDLDSLNGTALNYREIAPGTVQKQFPKPQEIVELGDPINIWVYKPDSVSNTATILDNQ